MKQCKTLLAGLLLLGAMLGTSLVATQPGYAQSASVTRAFSPSQRCITAYAV